MKLQAKILLILIPLIVVPMAALGYVSFTQLRETSEHEAFDQMISLTRQVELYAASRVETVMANIELFSNAALLARYLSISDAAQRYEVMQMPLMNLFSRFQKTYPEYYEMRILLPGGYEDTRSVNRDIGNAQDDERNTEYFQGIVRSAAPIYTTYFQNPDNDEFSLLVAKRLELTDPAVDPIFAKPMLRGYLAITVDLDFLRQQSLNSQFGERGTVFFTDRRGRILFHANAERENEYLDPNIMLHLREHSTHEDVQPES